MQLRVARHTNRLAEIVRFYRDGLGLREIGNFKDHDGYHGIFLALTGTETHLEFTTGGEHRGPTPPPGEPARLLPSAAWKQSTRHASASALNRSSRQTHTGRPTA